MTAVCVISTATEIKLKKRFGHQHRSEVFESFAQLFLSPELFA
jgi:hypothetical protein